MPKIREYNEEEAMKLDECFKETLARVRPFVLALTSTESAKLCKVWLNKLNAVTSQRRLRNEYLTELFRQLKTGHVGGVFSRPPPNGFLLPLPKSYHMVCISSSVSNLSDYTMRSHHSYLKTHAKCTQHQRSKASLKHRMMDVTRVNQCLHAMNHDQKLQAQNEYLRNQLLKYPENRNRNLLNDYLSSNISQLTTDVTTLKAKLKEMEQLKNSMDESYKEAVQEYHFIVMKQFTDLKQQLDESRLRNEALDHTVAVIAKKLEQISHGKDEQSKAVEQQWLDKIKMICERFDSFTKEKNKELQLKQDLLEKRDIESSKKDAGRKEEIELLTNKIQNLEMKLEMKFRDEDKSQKMIVEQYTMMKGELNKMRIEMDHETQKQNQNLMSEVSTLKKAVVKLEKSKERLEYDYEKKLSHIIKNKDMEIKALHLQLQKQKNELYTSLSIKKQNEVDNIVSILEDRYKTLLAETEAMSESKIQEYLMRIAILEDQVLNMKKFESSL